MAKRETIVKYAGMDEVYCAWFDCKNCNSTDIIKHLKYCPSCGYKINWENSTMKTQ